MNAQKNTLKAVCENGRWTVLSNIAGIDIKKLDCGIVVASTVHGERLIGRIMGESAEWDIGAEAINFLAYGI